MCILKKGETDLSLSGCGNQDKNCVVQAILRDWNWEVIKNQGSSGAISFFFCPHLYPLLFLSLFAYWLPLLSLSPGPSWLSIKCHFQYQGLYHFKNPEPWPSDPFQGLNYSVLWENAATLLRLWIAFFRVKCLSFDQISVAVGDRVRKGWLDTFRDLHSYC